MEWGVAEEAGFAVDWLERNGLPGTKALAYYLENQAHDLTASQCPINLGCTIVDTGDWHKAHDVTAYQPLLLVPFAAAACAQERLSLTWNNSYVVLNAKGIIDATDISTLISSDKTKLQISALTDEKHRATHAFQSSRVSSDNIEAYEVLQSFARKTYAPATDASRLAGAGAGLNDND